MTALDDFQELVYEVRDHVAYVTLNRPAQRNALTSRLYGELKWAVRKADYAADVDILVLSGAGGYFAPGGDLRESLDRVAAPDGVLRMQEMADNHPFDALRMCEKPIIAKIEGACMAGGMIIASWCDIQIATESTVFGLPEAKIGMVEVYAPYVLYGRMPLPKLKYHYLTGKSFSAQQAEQWEIITEVVPDGTADVRVAEVIEEIRGTAPVARSLVKRYLNDLVPITADNGARRSWESTDFVEGLSAFTEKRPPNYRLSD